MVASTVISSDDNYQTQILQGVSRTFALTIPVLPPPLYRTVSNAYLLCRIADTIEDDANLSFAAKREFSELFLAGVRGANDGSQFGSSLSDVLAPHNSAAERDLITNTARVLRITHSLNATQRDALARCVQVMLEGMVFYQGQETLDGLADQQAMDRYCYYVAGVVGEMLTELFCEYSPSMRTRHAELMRLGVSFGQGLQMTNILKDIWEDRARGACWLPRDGFLSAGIRLSNLAAGSGGTDFAAALRGLIGIAHGHLCNALSYTLAIPKHEIGMRKFCLWALGMAVLTLRKVDSNPWFTDGQQVKISRRSVKLTIATTSLAATHNSALRGLFHLASHGLPTSEIAALGPTLIAGHGAPRSL
ncbi:MAG: squalene/phytoene synthase family protein [Gammaproteobacteria bacterium]|nr:squalene/phytoene synthase family protein [Gammaproteobacteria bacterium]